MSMHGHALDFYGFSNEDGDGCMAVFVAFPEIKGVGETFEEAEADAYEQLEQHFKTQEKTMTGTFNKAVAAYESKQYDEAYGLFEEAAEANPNAMVNLALMHMKGAGCEQSYQSAKRWFEQAAERGNTHALQSLALFYEKGMHGTADADKAFEYYRRAADAGNVAAQLKTGMLYRERGNNAEAMRYLVTAAHNNNPQAQEIITYVSNASLASERNEAFHCLDAARQKALVENLIETKIRPTLSVDGGGIELVNYVPGDTPQIWLNYLGACSGCHLGSTSTADMLLDHFETMIDKNVVLYLM
jgi:Fe-S cluster biogenesis protein NfuA